MIKKIIHILRIFVFYDKYKDFYIEKKDINLLLKANFSCNAVKYSKKEREKSLLELGSIEIFNNYYEQQ